MLTGVIIKVLEVFHHWVEIRITGMTARRMTSGEWEWPPVAEGMDTAEIWPIKEFLQRSQNTVATQVACQSIYEMCMGADSIPVISRFMWWQ